MQDAVTHLVARAAFASPGDADIRNRMSCAGRVGRIEKVFHCVDMAHPALSSLGQRA
jgi:hypothetical protein